jgi:hypothetical protein
MQTSANQQRQARPPDVAASSRIDSDCLGPTPARVCEPSRAGPGIMTCTERNWSRELECRVGSWQVENIALLRQGVTAF